MKKFNYKDDPIVVFGIPTWDEKKVFRRLPQELLDILSERLAAFPKVGHRCSGARLCFRTNSEKFKVKITLETLSTDIGMSIYACQSAHVFIGTRREARFAGLVSPENYETLIFENEFRKNNLMEDITVFLPFAEIISDVEIYIEENSEIEAPTPYKYDSPVVFYGSSITEGAHATSPANSYTALISNHLDVDYYNLGFSGSAKGDIEIADYINTLKMSAFVLDYDHNTPDVPHLEKTHKAFFEKIREKHPKLPIVMMSSPGFDYGEDRAARRDVIKRTFEEAVKNGDNNVYYIDGERFFGNKDRHFCTTDTVHPNDLGHYRMAEVIEPVLKKILEEN